MGGLTALVEWKGSELAPVLRFMEQGADIAPGLCAGRCEKTQATEKRHRWPRSVLNGTMRTLSVSI